MILTSILQFIFTILFGKHFNIKKIKKEIYFCIKSYICANLKCLPMTEKVLKKEGRYTYYEAGEGIPIVILHGLMGGLSNFDGVADFFPDKGYKVIIPQLPIYTQNILKTNVKAFAKFVKDFITFKKLDRVILLGNSLGGHIALYHAKMYPEKMLGLIITGSSGLYESAMGDSYPRRGDYDYIQKKAEAVFYDPKIATKEIVGDHHHWQSAIARRQSDDRRKIRQAFAGGAGRCNQGIGIDAPVAGLRPQARSRAARYLHQ